jgi:DNA-binding response OmpR family regulator
MQTLSKNGSILVVDDEPRFRELTSRRLANAGYVVSVADSGAAAIERLELEAFDLVLLDVNMDGMNGLEVLEWMKDHNLFRFTKVIMLSAETNRDVVVSCVTLGAQDYLVKYSKFFEILKRIERLCLTRKMEIEEMRGISDSELLTSRILIVDDNEANRDILKRKLTRAGYMPHALDSGEQALAYIESHPVDMVLLDIHMPGMDGYEVLTRLREQHSATALAVIMVTAVTEQDSVRQCYDLGADDYITKPFNTAELLMRVAATLRLKLLSGRSDAKTKRLQELADIGKTLRDGAR